MPVASDLLQLHLIVVYMATDGRRLRLNMLSHMKSSITRIVTFNVEIMTGRKREIPY